VQKGREPTSLSIIRARACVRVLYRLGENLEHLRNEPFLTRVTAVPFVRREGHCSGANFRQLIVAAHRRASLPSSSVLSPLVAPFVRIKSRWNGIPFSVTGPPFRRLGSRYCVPPLRPRSPSVINGVNNGKSLSGESLNSRLDAAITLKSRAS